MASPWHARAGLALVLVTFALVIAAALMLLPRAPPEASRARDPEVTTRARPSAPGAARLHRPAADAPACAPEVAACHEGDVWLIDACGVALERLEGCEGGCEGGSCRDAAPEEVGDPCVGLFEHGVCEGDVAVGCAGRQPFRVECGAAGKRCVMTSEGAVCRAPSADGCVDEAPRCDDDTLRYCRDGRWEGLDCRSQGARCDELLGRCVLATPAAASSPCGACGCGSGPVGDEVCDGRDNDGDGEIDEGVACEPVPILFFVVGDRPGSRREDLEAEIARLDRTFAGEGEGEGDGGLGLRFSILDVVTIERTDWIDPDEAIWSAMARAEALHPKREGFYVPVALVSTIVMGDVPRAGVATVPNGVCGGRRRGAATQLPVGLVMVADRRSRTTLAHEIGHFLGLCHTHQEDADVVERVVLASDGAAVECDEACRAEGDGVCDTPADPGVEVCAADRECAITCPGDQRPDPRNIMSYYTWCRQRFSAEQLALVRTSLWLRRGWHPCIAGRADDACACTPGLGECPEGMSCWPHAGGASCWLDGPVPPGAGPCEHHLECSHDALCISGPERSACARACLLSAPGCTCVEVGADLRVCREDFGPSGQGGA